MDGRESEKSPSWDFVATELNKDFPSCNRKAEGTRDHYKESLKFYVMQIFLSRKCSRSPSSSMSHRGILHQYVQVDY